MPTTIQIKRSGNATAPQTTDLVVGELAYSQDKNNNGVGAKLYIESLNSGDSPVIHAIGGKFYTDKIDAATNSNTADAIVKRDSLGNFAANTITATTFVGNISVALGTSTTGDYVSNVLAGTGIQVTGQGGETATPTVALTNTGVVANTYGGLSAIPVIVVDAQGRITSAANSEISVASTAFSSIAVAGQSTVVADSGSDTVTFVNGTGIAITTDSTGDNVTFTLNNTAVSPSTYGGTTQVPVITVDQQGRITSAANAAISTSFTVSGDSGTNQTVNGGDTLTISGGVGLSSVASATDTITINLDNTAVVANTYGGAGTTPVITVDQQGRLTSAANVTTTVLNTNISGNITASQLAPTGVTSSTYGSSSIIGVFTVDPQGRITSASNVNVLITPSQISGDIELGNKTSGAYVANLIAGTGITITGLANEGATPTITNAGVTSITGTANEVTVSGSTGSITIGLPDNITVGGDLSVTGNLNVLGNVVSYGVENLVVEDSLIQLANNNISSDVVDIGFYGSYNTGGGEHEHAGLFRDASDSGKFKLFDGLQGQSNLTTTVNVSGTGFSVATLVANLTGGTVSGLTANIAVSDGGTGRGVLTTNAILYGQGTSQVGLATGSAGQVLQLDNSGVPVFGGLDGGSY